MFTIVKDNAKSLRARSSVVENITQEEIDLVNKMHDYLVDSQDEKIREKYHLREGVGLAAPQIGKNIRALVVYYTTIDDEGNETDDIVLDADGNPNLSLGFTPSPEAAQAVKNIETVVTDSETLQPEITEVYDLQTKSSGGTISPGSDIRIHGKRIKLADYEDSRSFVAFAPCNKNGTITETDKSMWQKVYAADLSTNKPSELQFYVPKFLPEGTYKIIVSTHFLKNGKKAKTAARTCQSEQIIKVLQEQ